MSKYMYLDARLDAMHLEAVGATTIISTSIIITISLLLLLHYVYLLIIILSPASRRGQDKRFFL